MNAEVTLELASGLEVISIITVKSLELKEGKEAYAIIKASNVMVAVDD